MFKSITNQENRKRSCRRLILLLFNLSAVICEGMPNFFAYFVWVDAYSVGAEGGASWGDVFCSGSSLAAYVFYLVSGEAFVEVGEGSE